jgi:hypothetical protein
MRLHILRIFFGVTAGVIAYCITSTAITSELVIPLLAASCSAYIASVAMLITIGKALPPELFFLSANQLLSIMRRKKFDAVLHGDRTFNWEIDGVPLNANLVINEKGERLNFKLAIHDGISNGGYIGDSGTCGNCGMDAKSGGLDANEWNMKKPLSRTYTIGKFRILAMSLNIKGGVTEASIAEFLDKCVLRAKDFWQEIIGQH